MKQRFPGKSGLGILAGWPVAALLLAAIPARSHEQGAPLTSEWRPAALKNVKLQPELGAQLPLAARFRDASGKQVPLASYFGRKPSILVFAYFDCPMLCPVVLEGLVRSLKPLSLDVGRDFDVLVISIEERDGPEAAREKKRRYVGLYGRDGSAPGWHFLTADRREIDRVAESAGFRYAYDDATGQYAHASGIFVLTPEGRIARVLYGVDFPSRDLRLALIEASNGEIGTPIDQMLLYCYHYDPATGKYGMVVMNMLRVAGSATALALGGFIVVMLRRDRRRRGGTESA